MRWLSNVVGGDSVERICVVWGSNKGLRRIARVVEKQRERSTIIGDIEVVTRDTGAASFILARPIHLEVRSGGRRWHRNDTYPSCLGMTWSAFATASCVVVGYV